MFGVIGTILGWNGLAASITLFCKVYRIKIVRNKDKA